MDAVRCMYCCVECCVVLCVCCVNMSRHAYVEMLLAKLLSHREVLRDCLCRKPYSSLLVLRDCLST